MTGSEQVLVEDWCQQYPVHTGGGLAFGADGYLYFTGGDGSTATFWDYGHTGTPANPCGDPPGAVGDVLTAPTAEGGRLRVQDLRTPGDPTGLDGTLIRIDPRTGAGVSGNPLFGSPYANERRILAYGLRDAVRLAIRPGTNDVWVGDRGGGYWEEFDRVPDTGTVRNFGWPCYEGGMDAQGDPYTRIRPRERRGEHEHLQQPLRGRRPDRSLRTGPTTTSCPSSPARPARRTRSARPPAASCPACRSTRPRAAASRLPTARRCSSPTGCGTASMRCCPAPTGCRSAAT